MSITSLLSSEDDSPCNKGLSSKDIAMAISEDGNKMETQCFMVVGGLSSDQQLWIRLLGLENIIYSSMI